MIILHLPSKFNYILKNHTNLFKKVYYDLIYSTDFSNVCCKDCHSNSWKIHSSYERRLRIGSTIHIITIQRIYCTHCGKTHAILLDCLVPFNILNSKEIINMVTCHNLYKQILSLFKTGQNLYLFLCALFSRNEECFFIPNSHESYELVKIFKGYFTQFY